MGYPRLATFLSSDTGFMQYRGFHSLRSRMLLAQQYDLEVLERELDSIDRWENEQGSPQKLMCKERDDLQARVEDMPVDFPFSRTRPEIYAEVKKQLTEYGR